MQSVGFRVFAEVSEQQGLVEGVVEGSGLEFDQAGTEQKQVVEARQSFLVEVGIGLLAVVIVGRRIAHGQGFGAVGERGFVELERLVEGTAGQIEQERVFLVLAG